MRMAQITFYNPKSVRLLQWCVCCVNLQICLQQTRVHVNKTATNATAILVLRWPGIRQRRPAKQLGRTWQLSMIKPSMTTWWALCKVTRWYYFSLHKQMFSARFPLMLSIEWFCTIFPNHAKCRHFIYALMFVIFFFGIMWHIQTHILIKSNDMCIM